MLRNLGWERVVEIILQTVKVKVDDGDLAVKLGIEGRSGVSRVLRCGLVHLVCNIWWDI